MSKSADFVIIGAGINGLVAAAELALAGHSVTILERTARIGGFIDSGERTAPGFIHDTFSSWHPLFVSGGAYATLGAKLHAHGLTYVNSDGPVTASASVGPGGAARAVIAHRDPELTARAFEYEADRDAYLAMLAKLDDRSATIFGAFGAELRSFALAKLGLRALRSLGIRGSEALLRDAVTSGRSFARDRFRGWEIDALWMPWLLHAGIGPDQASGGIMLPVFAASTHGFGLPIVQGGAAGFLIAWESLLTELGVDVRLESTAEEILLESGRARGVRAGGETFHARTAVIASVSPAALYGRLLPVSAVPAVVADQAGRYRAGRAAMQIHLALDRPLDWFDERLREVPLIHLSNGSASTGIACAQAEAGLLPAEPTIVVGQQSMLDPTRAPAGKATLWLQLQEVPYAPVDDAAGELDTGAGWSAELVEGYLQRVLTRLEVFATGVRESVISADVLTPLDLERHNINAERGDPYGGSVELDQNLLWRPFPSAAGHKTAVRGLWHIGASTHPGPGLAGGSGHLVATTLKRTRRRRPPR